VHSSKSPYSHPTSKLDTRSTTTISVAELQFPDSRKRQSAPPRLGVISSGPNLPIKKHLNTRVLPPRRGLIGIMLPLNLLSAKGQEIMAHNFMNLAVRTVHLISNTKLRSFSLPLQCPWRHHKIETVNDKGIFGVGGTKLKLGSQINGIKVLNCNAF
jgi:hypothetical protein